MYNYNNTYINNSVVDMCVYIICVYIYIYIFFSLAWGIVRRATSTTRPLPWKQRACSETLILFVACCMPPPSLEKVISGSGGRRLIH